MTKICNGNYFDDEKMNNQFFISKGHKEQKEELIRALKSCYNTLSMPTLYGYLKTSNPRGET